MDREPRVVCYRCGRPASVCWCAHLPSIPTRTRVVILQHPRERHMPIGTGRMASLCLEGASLHYGVDFERDAAVRAVLADPTRPAALLWPGEGAIDLATSPPEGPITLVVVDGTWAQAKKVVRVNPTLRALPRYAFAPPAPSAYRIRREPRDDYVSTIEALAHVLTLLEGDRFGAMLAPFAAMIDAQIEHRDRLRSHRHVARPAATPKPPRLPAELGAEHLVCVSGDANAWPYRPGKSQPDELVHWVAHRLSTGESFEAFIAPRRPLSPSVPMQARLSLAQIEGGESFAAFDARFRAFLREDDVVCAWGYYATELLQREGGHLPSARVELRKALGDLLKAGPGSLDDVGERLGVAPLAPLAPLGHGRAGERLARTCEVARYLAAEMHRRSAPRAIASARSTGEIAPI
ncbi:MAG: tRNA-uridine aminocarboxypropyltransferase [Minicystis sp.]